MILYMEKDISCTCE